MMENKILILFITCGIFAIAILFCYALIQDASWKSYERGAWAVVLHHKYFGNYGSKAYREVAYKWGDPQAKEDVEEILRIVKEKYRE